MQWICLNWILDFPNRESLSEDCCSLANLESSSNVLTTYLEVNTCKIDSLQFTTQACRDCNFRQTYKSSHSCCCIARIRFMFDCTVARLVNIYFLWTLPGTSHEHWAAKTGYHTIAKRPTLRLFLLRERPNFRMPSANQNGRLRV